MRVLIIGINYRPELTGIGPYTAGLAEHLASRGDDVTVITGLPHYPGWRIAAGTPRTIDPRGVDRRRSRHPRRPLTCRPRQDAVRRALYEATFGLTGLVASLRLPNVRTPSSGSSRACPGGVLARLLGGASGHRTGSCSRT